MTSTELAQKIYEKYGFVTRARNTFLYTKKGVRLTDLFQEDGHAILGWDAGSAFTHLKNALSKALVGSFICEDKPRIEKAASTLFNSQRKVFYFFNKQAATKAGIMFSPQNTSFYKPWNSSNIDYSKIDSIIFAPPLPGANDMYILTVKTDAYNSLCTTLNCKELSFETFQGCVKIPYAMEAGITRSIYNLIQELPLRQEKDFFIYDTVLTKYWERKGPYLLPKVPKDKYDKFVCHCLENEIVINPKYDSPSIVPFGADKGVFTKLKNNPFEF